MLNRWPLHDGANEGDLRCIVRCVGRSAGPGRPGGRSRMVPRYHRAGGPNTRRGVGWTDTPVGPRCRNASDETARTFRGDALRAVRPRLPVALVVAIRVVGSNRLAVVPSVQPASFVSLGVLALAYRLDGRAIPLVGCRIGEFVPHRQKFAIRTPLVHPNALPSTLRVDRR